MHRREDESTIQDQVNLFLVLVANAFRVMLIYSEAQELARKSLQYDKD